MSGPRISTGVDSKQDYATPANFIAAVEKRFGKLAFDLAAHAGNKQCAAYFTPRTFAEDHNAFGFDAFRDDDGNERRWCDLHETFGPGPLWLNCEFSDITPWAKKSAIEGKRGANVLLLTPAVCAIWYRDDIAGVADVYDLSGRLCFDGKNVFPKDCRLSHFHPNATGKLSIWEWSKDVVHREWSMARPASPTSVQGRMFR